MRSRRFTSALAAPLLATAAIVGCDGRPAPLPAAQTAIEAKLARYAQSVNDLHRAIDLAAAGRDADAVALLRSAPRTPDNLRIETLSAAEFASLGDADRAEAAQVVELRGLAARPLIDSLVDDATIRKARGDAAGAEVTCELIAAIVDANQRSSSRFVALWSAKVADTALRACP
ncbi:MAG: hypothetical protein JNM94_09095 [Phycisphaerae bacterium]|nr:hypothetical protein [Phycisphaerae bacterium]